MSCNECGLNSDYVEMMCYIGKQSEDMNIKFIYKFDIDDCMCLCFANTCTNFNVILCEECIIKISENYNFKIDKSSLNDLNIIVNDRKISNEIFRSKLAHIIAKHFDVFNGTDLMLISRCRNICK